MTRDKVEWLKKKNKIKPHHTPIIQPTYILYQVRSGQVRSECLTCTFRASCCSLSRPVTGTGTSLRRFLCQGQDKKRGEEQIYPVSQHIYFYASPDGAVAKSLANGLVGTGFVSRYRLQPRAGF